MAGQNDQEWADKMRDETFGWDGDSWENEFSTYLPPRWRKKTATETSSKANTRSKPNTYIQEMNDEMYADYVRRHMQKRTGQVESPNYTFVYGAGSTFESERGKSKDTKGNVNEERKKQKTDRERTRTKKEGGTERKSKRTRTRALSPASRDILVNEQRRRARTATMTRQQKREIYEKSWTNMKASTTTTKLTFGDIYWPVYGNVDVGSKGLQFKMHDLKDFLVGDCGDGSVLGHTETKKKIRLEQIRWHQDKFVQMFGTRLDSKDRGVVLESVHALSSSLNDLWTSVC